MKNSICILAVTAVAACVLSGCAAFTSPAREHQLDPHSAYWLDYDASRRGTIVVPDGAKMTSCSEPSPDVALTFAEQVLAQVQTNAGGQTPVDVNVQAQLNQSIVELAGRTETIMFLRESLYRLCEQSANGTLAKEDVKSLYETAITAALKLAEADLAKNQASLAQALKDPGVRKIWDLMHSIPKK